MGTEPKSPREIAEDGITDLDAANYAIDYFSWWMTWEQERANKAEAYAAERERLLAEALNVLAPFAAMHREGSDPQEIACKRGYASDLTLISSGDFAKAARILRSRPATEGKR